MIEKCLHVKSNTVVYRFSVESKPIATARVILKKVKQQDALLDSLIVFSFSNRNRGFGKTLLEHVFNDLCCVEKRTRLLATKPTKEAIAFYLKMGFVKINNHHYEKQLATIKE